MAKQKQWRVSIDTTSTIEAETEGEAKEKFLEGLDAFDCEAEEDGVTGSDDDEDEQEEEEQDAV